MKKSIMKVLASMLVLAMAITALVIPNASAKAAENYYIAGSMQGWDNGNDAWKMTQSGDNYVYTLTRLEADVIYEFKVTDGTWDNAWPSSNYTFKLETVSDVVVTFNSTSKEITIAGEGLPKTAEYYVCGSMNEWALMHADYAMTKVEGNYVLTIKDLEVGTYMYKVNNGTWNEAYPEKDAEFEVKQAGEVVITLNGTTHEVTATGSALEEIETETPTETETETPTETETETETETSTESQTPTDTQNPDDSEEEEKSDYTPVYKAATIAGDFSKLTNPSITASWDVANTAANMKHLGNGIYVYELTFDKTTEEITVNYKVAFDNSWDTAIGYDYEGKKFTTADGSDNLYITIPAGTTSVKIYADENGLVAYNTIQNPDEAAALLAIVSKGDANIAVIGMLILAGAALVAVGVISKKKAA